MLFKRMFTRYPGQYFTSGFWLHSEGWTFAVQVLGVYTRNPGTSKGMKKAVMNEMQPI